MDKRVTFSSKYILLFVVITLALSGIFYYAAFERINYKRSVVTVPNQSGYTNELRKGTEIRQIIDVDYDFVESVSVSVATFARINRGVVTVEMTDDEDNVLSRKSFDMAKIEDNSQLKVWIEKEKPPTAYLRIYSEDGATDQSITVYYDESSSVFGNSYSINGMDYPGNIKMSVVGGVKRNYSWAYWAATAVIVMVSIVLGIWTIKTRKSGKNNFILLLIDNVSKYAFLVKQLVARDFKTKYKRSVLGIFWSLLNPLMIMGIQYILFSRIFRTNIENYPIYLFGGTVLFTFFADSVSSGLFAIVGNASLITKVYVPKYIYPISKVFSTGINLLLSLLPLTVALFITHVRFTKAFLLIPYVFLCLLLFCFGMTFLFSALMVFFRDMQFIWSVLSMVWMYATPLFYPETIIPERVRMLLKINPLYHYVSFFRSILLEGVSPSLMEYVWCLGTAIAVLAFGAFVFKKSEGKFALFV